MAPVEQKEKPARDCNPCGLGTTKRINEANMPVKNRGRNSRVSIDAILASSPVNSTAARVVSAGTHWVPVSHRNEREWGTPPDVRAISTAMRVNPSFTDFTGKTLGRLVCIGLAAEAQSKAKGGGTKWVMRCACSNFVVRSAKALKNQANNDDCCPTCRAMRAIRFHQTAEGQRKLREKEAV